MASWQTSIASTEGACVQVARGREHVWVRDSKAVLGPVLGFSHDAWAAFLVGVHGDEFGPPNQSR
ncbi:MAG TPA: DUF397 domain-containing protein [Pseudonocardiaceae bacterium]|nr:DUF397 domain-containing protein [Pseudonocardiaceae bacterium]